MRLAIFLAISIFFVSRFTLVCHQIFPGANHNCTSAWMHFGRSVIRFSFRICLNFFFQTFVFPSPLHLLNLSYSSFWLPLHTGKQEFSTPSPPFWLVYSIKPRIRQVLFPRLAQTEQHQSLRFEDVLLCVFSYQLILWLSLSSQMKHSEPYPEHQRR